MVFNSATVVISLRGDQPNLRASEINGLDNLKSLIRLTNLDRLPDTRISRTASNLPLTETALIESGFVSASSSGVSDPLSLSRPSTSARAVGLSDCPSRSADRENTCT